MVYAICGIDSISWFIHHFTCLLLLLLLFFYSQHKTTRHSQRITTTTTTMQWSISAREYEGERTSSHWCKMCVCFFYIYSTTIFYFYFPPERIFLSLFCCCFRHHLLPFDHYYRSFFFFLLCWKRLRFSSSIESFFCWIGERCVYFISVLRIFATHLLRHRLELYQKCYNIYWTLLLTTIKSDSLKFEHWAQVCFQTKWHTIEVSNFLAFGQTNRLLFSADEEISQFSTENRYLII